MELGMGFAYLAWCLAVAFLLLANVPFLVQMRDFYNNSEPQQCSYLRVR